MKEYLADEKYMLGEKYANDCLFSHDMFRIGKAQINI